MLCPNCKKQINDTAVFCPFCGQKITQPASAQEIAPAVKQPGKKGKPYVAIGIAAVICAVLLMIFLPKILNGKDTDTSAVGANDTSAIGNGDTQSLPVVDTEPEASAQESAQSAPDQETGEQNRASRTLMLYLCGSDLERKWGCATKDIQEILNAKRGEHMNIVIQSGGCTKWHNDWMTDGTVQRFVVEGDSLTKLADFGRASMVQPESLTDFIRFSAEAYPADSYILILWDHGGGIPIIYGVDEVDTANNLDALEIRDAIKKSGIHFETIAFDACLMGTLETVYALKDCADYVVGAESTVVGNGMYYTGFTELMSSEKDVAAQDYCEKMVQDYIDSAHKADQATSMSVIRTKYIQDVYDAYVEYIRQALSAYNKDAFPQYVQALEQCGRYEQPDCVDMSMLASFFENDHSVKLANAINNAVAFTLSDYRQGRGITAYSPYQRPESYDRGRSLFTGLGYDDTILAFYDQFVSDVAVIVGGQVLTAVQGQKWFTGASAMVAQQTTAGTTGGSYSLEVTDMGDYGAVVIPESLRGNIKHVFKSVWMQGRTEANQHQYHYFGTNSDHSAKDKDGNIIFGVPKAWPSLLVKDNRSWTIDFDMLYYYDDGSKYMYKGVTPCRVNGRSAYIYLVYDNEHDPRPLVEGYVFADLDGTGAPEDDTRYALQEGDVIMPLYRIMDLEKDETTYKPIDEVVYGESFFSNNETFNSEDTFLVQYIIEDVYGNTYSSQIYPQDAFSK